MKDRLELLLMAAIGGFIGTSICYLVNHYVDDASAAVITLAFLVLAVIVGMFMPKK